MLKEKSDLWVINPMKIGDDRTVDEDIDGVAVLEAGSRFGVFR